MDFTYSFSLRGLGEDRIVIVGKNQIEDFFVTKDFDSAVESKIIQSCEITIKKIIIKIKKLRENILSHCPHMKKKTYNANFTFHSRCLWFF